MALELAGCASKPPADDTFDDLATVDAKSDYFSYRLKMLGTVTDGASMSVPYTRTPRFRGVTVGGTAGDMVDIWVRATDGGDAVAWLLDDHYKVIAKNDDADDTTADSHLHAVLPASPTGTYKVVLRDYYVKKHAFTVSYDVTTAASPPSSATSPLVQAFLPLYHAGGATYATDSHVVAETSLPTVARSGFGDFVGASPSGTTVTAWRFKVGTATGYAVMMAFDQQYFVSLYNAAGTWVAHGHTNDLGASPAIDWELNIDDPSICRCGLAPDGSGYAGCEWVDGQRYASDISDCD